MKRTAPILVCTLLAAGCASMTRDTADTCSSKETCTVSVTVRGCSWKNIDVKPEVLWVKRGYKGEVTWKLAAPDGWEFAKNGIEFKNAKNPEFVESRHGAREFWWFDKNSKKGSHDYSVNVTPPGGGKPCTRDPTVMNDGEP